MTYRLGLLSEIPVVERHGQYWALDLWVKDLQAQAACVQSVTLFCPVTALPTADTVLLPLPDAVKVVDLTSTTPLLTREVAEVDVVQIPGNFTWRGSRRARLFTRIAHRAGKPAMLAISSDRATTMLVNSRGQNFVRRLRARLGSFSITTSQRYLAQHCEGAFVVGEGLRRIVEPSNRNVFVGTASWIRSSDIQPALARRRDPAAIRLCIAARLEQMKGIHVGLDAFADLDKRTGLEPLSLFVAGAGPEEAALRAQSASLQLGDSVTFAGTFAYPEPFFEMLRSQDIVVLTNLNDEQPRLVFDAVSQGCLIVCPDSLPYRALGIPRRLLYRRGDATSLADAIASAIAAIGDLELRLELQAMSRTATIESMHERRRDWVNTTLLAGAGRAPDNPELRRRAG